jgi:hypothetical protein
VEAIRALLVDGEHVEVSEVALRRIFRGWRVSGVEWHVGRVVDCCDLISIPQHNVNVDVSLLLPSEMRQIKSRRSKT